MESAGSRPKDDVSLPKGKEVISYHEYFLNCRLVSSLTFIFVMRSLCSTVSAFQLTVAYVEPCW